MPEGVEIVNITISELASFLETPVAVGLAEGPLGPVSTDSRTLKQGDCFVALKGNALDGHDFVPQAVRAGAACLVVERPFPEYADTTQILVRDTLHALGEIARLWRSKLDGVKIAVFVGSSGKTTAKEMAAKIIGASMPTLATQGNLNNLIGVPQMIFQIQPSHKAAILELGMNMAGELRRLVEITSPHCVAMTNISNAHIGMFSSQEDLFQAKTDSLKWSPEESVLVMNTDDPLSRRAREDFARGRQVVNFGYGEDAQVTAREVERLVPFGYRFRLAAGGDGDVLVNLHIFGRHNIMNALAAAAVAKFFGVALPDIAAGLDGFRTAANRSEVEEVNGWFIVKDYYNASPAAVEQALLGLEDFSVPGRRFAVLGDMLELGAWERMYHTQVGTVAAGVGLSKLFTVGMRGAHIGAAALAKGQPSEHFADAESVAARLKEELRPGDLLLIKGSRLMKLEKIYELLKG